ncbi:5'-nucleotidase C-terminal domain-containing protein [Clostridium bowmanii]|uniref:5'-nucleotidase C-terminal domain-containing protein n=1 Tax=Clostridium bowmanii TaxID=132925 RepID=UPI001C0ACEF2|nr:5'-nucleotidase C-terminal domain-containing protein [Clostridium bowmanii]MBU3189960.1 5'-nucleotidase C-terminal domain-containing protein [Clostridium bowmanii]MCA1074606.1 5'-nucleotidase C-terminal domain-containing protein [Clostridium bowmanii]
MAEIIWIMHIEGGMVIKDHLNTRLKDNAYAEFINNVQMEAAKVEISCTSIFDNNCKGFKHNVTMRDIISNYKYPNTLKVISLKGVDIKAALERTAEYFTIVNAEIEVSKTGIYNKLQHYNYDMREGIDYIIDILNAVVSTLSMCNLLIFYTIILNTTNS